MISIHNKYIILIKKFTAIVLVVISTLFLACSADFQPTDYNLFFGAQVEFFVRNRAVVLSEHKYKKLNAELKELSDNLDRLLSVESRDSDVCRFNSQTGGDSIEINKITYDLLRIARDIYLTTDKSYNPCVKRLVDLWGFSSRYAEINYIPLYPFDRERLLDGGFLLPNEKYVKAFKELSDFEKLNLTENNGNYYVNSMADNVSVDGETYNLQLDLSGVAKGYFTDEAVKIINNYGLKNYFLSVGGSSLYLDGDWTMEIVDPFSATRSAFSKVRVNGKFVSTSGTYENYYIIDEKNYSHIIDCKTGAPVESDLVSVTLFGNNGAMEDGLSTALVVMKKQNAIKFLSEHKELSFVLVTAEKEVITNLGADFLLIDGCDYKVTEL